MKSAEKLVTHLSAAPAVDTLLTYMDTSLVECFTEEADEHSVVRTSDHAVETAVYAAEAAHPLGLDESMVEAVTLGALLHDTGKGEVPGAILAKAGTLVGYERHLMREHPLKGAIRVRAAAEQDQSQPKPAFEPWQWDMAIALTALHHTFKTFNKQRYPDFSTLLYLRDTGIMNTTAWLTVKKYGHGEHVAVCDAYSALGSQRSYLPSRLAEEGLPNPAEYQEPRERNRIITQGVRNELRLSSRGEKVLLHLGDVATRIPFTL